MDLVDQGGGGRSCVENDAHLPGSAKTVLLSSFLVSSHIKVSCRRKEVCAAALGKNQTGVVISRIVSIVLRNREQ